MDEWKINLKKLLVDIFWWNSKLFKIILSNIGKKQDFLGVYKKNSWKVKIEFKYVMNYTKSNIIYSVNKSSRFTSNLNIDHWKAIWMVLKYLRCKLDYSYIILVT
jgi:hypothetical protein